MRSLRNFCFVFVFMLKYDFLAGENSGPGKPLFLTPLIEKGRISEAREKSVVKPFIRNVESYAGYFTVNKQFNSNLFFWFFKADDENWENLPVAVWLEGGPGSSSLFSVFVLNGPYKFVNKKLTKNKYSWHKKCNMIYVDNPVGAGYSFTDSDEGYARNQTVISEQLYSLIKQFFIMFPNLLKNDFYLTGESYAGKYVPAFAHTIHKKNALTTPGHVTTNLDDKMFINLKGLFIGNGFVDPVNMMIYGDYFYQIGLIDTNTLKIFHDYEDQIRHAIKQEKWADATLLVGKLVLSSNFYPYKSLYQNVTGLPQHYDYFHSHPPDWMPWHQTFVTGDLFRRSVHVGNTIYDDGVKAAVALKEDITKSVIHYVEELLNHYHVGYYVGQVDVIVPYPMIINTVKKMKWSSSEEYAKAKRQIWKVNNEVAGYYKSAGNFTEILVRDAGHMVPSQQPEWMYILYDKFISSKNFNENQD